MAESDHDKQHPTPRDDTSQRRTPAVLGSDLEQVNRSAAESILDALPDLYVRLDADDRVVEVAGGAGNGHPLHSLSPATGEPRHPWELIEGPSADHLRQAIDLARATGRPVTTELSGEANGAPRWDEAHIVPLHGDGLLLIIREITERKQAELALDRGEEIHRTLLDNLPGMAYRCANNPDWTMEFVSDACLTLTGYQASDIVGDCVVSFGNLIHEDDRERVCHSVQAAIADARPWTIEYRIVTATGQEKWVLERGKATPRAQGSVSCLEGFISDVSDRHRAEEALRQSERQMQSLIANIPGAAYRCQPAPPWRDEFIAGACEELTGYSPAQLMKGEPLFEAIVHPLDRQELLGETERALAEDGRGAHEYRIRTAGGGEKWVWDRFQVTRDDNGDPLSLEGLLIDISDAHLAGEQLAASRQILTIHGRIATLFLTSPAETVFGDLLAVVREALESPWGFFGYLDEEGILVAPAAVAQNQGTDDGPSDPQAFPPDTWGDSLWGEVLRDGNTKIVNRPGLARHAEPRVDSALGVPLVHGDRTLGVLMVANRERAYGEQDATLLESIAAYTAPVLRQWLERASQERARRCVEAELRQSERRYRSLYEQSPVGVFLYDGELRLTDCNDTFAEIIGIPRERLRGFDMEHDLHDRSVLPALRRPLAGEPGLYEGAYTTSTSARGLWVTMRTAPRLDAAEDIVGGLAVVLDCSEQKRTEQEMEHLRLHDALTGLPNRSLFADRVAQAAAFAKRRRLGFGLVALSIDRFATLIDTLGREPTNRLLAATAQRLVSTMRSEDTVASLAPSEFGFLLPGVGGPAEASAAIEKIVEALALPFCVGEHELFLTVSLGVAVYPADGADPLELMENAEAAARRTSGEGGNGWQFFHAGMNAEHADRLELETELHRALEREQFLLHFQPVVLARDGAIVGLEALLRWEHPKRGLVPPLDFIPLAEETGLMVPIGNWVLAQACSQATCWNRRFGRNLTMAVNLSARQLYDDALRATIADAIAASGLAPDQLALEVTETAAMRDPARAAQVLSDLAKLGVRVALDDFGTGYSSLSHLIRLPISAVKIDRSFVRDLLTVPEHAAVAASVIALGHRLALTVIAEGVETEQERRFLRDEGCDAIQGYLFSRPLAAADCEIVLAEGTCEPRARG